VGEKDNNDNRVLEQRGCAASFGAFFAQEMPEMAALGRFDLLAVVRARTIVSVSPWPRPLTWSKSGAVYSSLTEYAIG